jgi:DinB superfamily
MSTDLGDVLPAIFRELVFGSSDPSARTYVVNQGDAGLLASLDRISAAEASATHDGGASIAAHVDHLRYGISLLGRWVSGSPPPWPDMDWTASWRKTVVSDAEWRTLRDELRREATRWLEALGTPRVLTEVGVGWMIGSVAHFAYHVGAIRQIDRATRGPMAEDEARPPT